MVTVLDKTPRHPEKANRPDTPLLRKPEWIRVKAPGSPVYLETREIMRTHGLKTVCEEAACPNVGECWSKRHATMMIMGDTCTRACAFCNVATGLPQPLDPAEPANVAEAVAKLGLGHVVITSVDRDDLADGGAAHFAEVVRAIRARTPATTIEILTPDFLRKDGALETVVASRPDVFNHNLETVPSLYLRIRPGARYFHSLRLLQRVKELDRSLAGPSAAHQQPASSLGPSAAHQQPASSLGPSAAHQQPASSLGPSAAHQQPASSLGPSAAHQQPAMFTKSGIMVGLGETREEVLQVMDDLRSADVDFLTIGQYLQPTRKHAEVKSYVTPEEFKAYERIALAKGFLLVSASPLTRSSYHADADFARLKAARLARRG